MTEDDLEVEIIEKNELAILVKESGLEQNKAQFMLEQFTDHYKMAAEWAKKAKNIVVTNEKQTVNMEMARTGRLFLRGKRIEIENARKALKEQSLKEGKAIDMIANFLKDLIIPTESHLDRQEHFIEYKKKAEDERILAEAHAKAEKDRIAKEEADAQENARLRREAAEHEKELAIERSKADAVRKEEQQKAWEAAEKIRKENEKNLAKERSEREKAEAELLAKRQTDAKAEADRIYKEEALKKAGDQEKLQILRESLMAIKLPEVKSIESNRIVANIKGYLNLAIMKIKVIVTEEE